MEVPFFQSDRTPEGRRRRLLILGLVGLLGFLVIIHHIRLEAAVRSDAGVIASARTAESSDPREKVGELSSRLEFLEAKLDSMATSLGWDECGGYIQLNPGFHRDIIYEVPPTSVPHVCVWVVSSTTAPNRGSILTQLMEDKRLRFNSNFTLRVVYNPAYNNCRSNDLTVGSKTASIGSQVIFIFFHGASNSAGEGFRLRLKDPSGTPSFKPVTYVNYDQNFTYRYPTVGLSKYGANQLLALVGAPAQGKGSRVTISGIHTEEVHDWVTLIWIDPLRSSSPLCRSASGPSRSNFNATISPSLPFVVFFSSDHSANGDGFNVAASFQ